MVATRNPSRGHIWGTNGEERARRFPCDRHLAERDDAYHRAIDVSAPPAIVFRWLCQLRVGTYSYGGIPLARGARELTPGLDALERGQWFMGSFELVEFERDRHLTLALRRGAWAYGDVVVTYLVEPAAGDGSRLLVKLVLRYPRLVARLYRVVGPWLDLVMMRRQLLNLKRLAERRVRSGGFEA
jgi:hypothetical protein